MTDFVPGRAMIDAAKRKRVKYEPKCANIRGGCDNPYKANLKVLRSSPLTQTRMTDFVPGRAMIDAAKRKRVKYEPKCANIRGGCDNPYKANLKVLRDSRYWGASRGSHL
nr:hypothetical protein [Tanacetum cinerariifolium]